MRLRLRLVLALSLASGPSAAQSWRQPSLIIHLNEEDRLSAWLSMPSTVPEPVAQVFAQAMGCPPASSNAITRSRSLYVECSSPLARHGLKRSGHWDFTTLNAELRKAGAETIELSLYHPRSGFSELQPRTISKSETAGFNVSYRGELALGDFHEISLETGFRPQQLRLLAAVTALILLLPLLLFPARTGGPLPALAGATGLFCLGATAWLWVTLSFNITALAPLPWNLLIVSLPMLAAVWIGSRIAGGSRKSMVFWRGARGVAFLALTVGLFNVISSLAWGACCAVGILICHWRLQKAGGHGLQPVGDGPLLARIRELASRAGTGINSAQLLLGGEDLPAAFATRSRGILLSPGLLTALSRREVDAVIAHELSHVRRPRIAITRGVAFLLPGAVVMAFLVPASVQWMPLLLPPAFLIHRALRRWIESRADADAVTWSGDSEALITALVRVTRANAMPLEWPRWVKPLMPHPSTLERVRALARRGRISNERFEQLLAGSTAPPADCYSIPGAADPAGSVFTPLARARLRTRLSLVSLVLPVAFGVAAPFLGYLAALLIGACGVCLATEWVLYRARARARTQLAGRPGVFCGFSPSLEPRLYDGSYDYDWGFAAFEGERLVFRGDRRSFTACRNDIEQIWIDRGPFTWFPRPTVCFRVKGGHAFCLRPFDGAFGPAAPRAAARLLQQAAQWYAAEPSGTATLMDFDFASVTGQVPPAYTWRLLLRALPRYGLITLALSWLFLTATPFAAWTSIERVVGPVALTWALTMFVAYPSLVRRPKPSPA